MTFLHYVCRSPHDGRVLSRPTIDRIKAIRDLERLRQQYPCCALATIFVDDDDDEPEVVA